MLAESTPLLVTPSTANTTGTVKPIIVETDNVSRLAGVLYYSCWPWQSFWYESVKNYCSLELWESSHVQQKRLFRCTVWEQVVYYVYN